MIQQYTCNTWRTCKATYQISIKLNDREYLYGSGTKIGHVVVSGTEIVRTGLVGHALSMPSLEMRPVNFVSRASQMPMLSDKGNGFLS